MAQICLESWAFKLPTSPRADKQSALLRMPGAFPPCSASVERGPAYCRSCCNAKLLSGTRGVTPTEEKLCVRRRAIPGARCRLPVLSGLSAEAPRNCAFGVLYCSQGVPLRSLGAPLVVPCFRLSRAFQASSSITRAASRCSLKPLKAQDLQFAARSSARAENRRICGESLPLPSLYIGGKNSETLPVLKVLGEPDVLVRKVSPGWFTPDARKRQITRLR